MHPRNNLLTYVELDSFFFQLGQINPMVPKNWGCFLFSMGLHWQDSLAVWERFQGVNACAKHFYLKQSKIVQMYVYYITLDELWLWNGLCDVILLATCILQYDESIFRFSFQWTMKNCKVYWILLKVIRTNWKPR